MKYIKYSNSTCEFCGKPVSEYFVQNGHIICKPCVGYVDDAMQQGADE